MTKIYNFQKQIKVIFFLATVLLITSELSHLKRAISLGTLENNFKMLSPWTILVMLVLGFIAVLPMLFYDVILNKEINSHYSKRYIFETSFMINTINNTAGFGGLIDTGLRYSFYSKDNDLGRTTQGISRIIPYFMGGLSLFSAVAFTSNFFFPINYEAKYYITVLFVGMLYLPIVIFISSRQGISYFGQLTPPTILKLILTSTIDWFSVIAYFLILGRLLNISFSIYEVIPLYLVSVILGLISMMPGGLGSFDLIMLMGLTSLGIDSAKAILWILLFRLFYFIIPFFLGITLFFKYLGGSFDKKFLGIPSSFAHLFLHNMEVLLLRLFGLLMILTAIMPNQLSQIRLFREYLEPVQEHFLWQFPSLIIGSLFVLLARLVQRRVRRTLSILGFLFVTTVIYLGLADLSMVIFIFATLLLAMVYCSRKYLNRQHFIYSLEDQTKDFLIITIPILLLHLVENYSPFKYHDLFKYHLNLEHIISVGGYSLFVVGVLLIAYKGMVGIVSDKKLQFGEYFDEKRFTNFINHFGGDSDSALAYLGDKFIYWYQEEGIDQVAFQLAIQGNKVIVMGHAMGNKELFLAATEAMLKNAKKENKEVIFYEIDQNMTMLLHDFGYEFIKFGETARVDLSQFDLSGKHSRKFRTSVNKLENKGFSFEVIDNPFSEELIAKLKEISDKWLNGRQEKGFSLGFFDESYLQRAPIAVVRDSSNEIIAFVNFLPTNSQASSTIDLMRYDSDKAPNGVMDYLFIKLFIYFKSEGVVYFELGMAPLSNVGTMENSFVQEKIAYMIYLFSKHFYSFTGLRQYKQKFNPIWETRYIAYPKKTWVIYNMLTIYNIDNRKIKK